MLPSGSNKGGGVRKRGRYIAYACNRCRAAKVRCNGKQPCSYCVARDPTSCHYRNPRTLHDSNQQEQQRFRGQQIQEEDSRAVCIPAEGASGISVSGYESVKMLLQQQNNKLDAILERVSNVEATQRLQQHEVKGPSSNAPLDCEEPLPVIQSSTSALFCIHVIDDNLKALEEPDLGALQPRGCKPPLTSSFSILHGQIVNKVAADIGEWGDAGISVGSSSSGRTTYSRSTNPLGSLENAELVRLIQKYDDVAGMMYPVVDIAKMLRLVEIDGHLQGLNAAPGSLPLRRSEATILQMMAAIALTAENENGSDLIQSLHDDVLPDVQHIVWNTNTDLHGLILLVLVGIFYYNTHKWRLAWRFLGNVARILVELGLNRQMVLDRSFPQIETRTQALNVIWSVFVLEQQLRHGLGLSSMTQDLTLDSTFPKPVNAPYLDAMIQYLRIANPTTTIIFGRHSTQLTPQEFQEVYSYFQYRLSEWYKNIDCEFQLKAEGKRIEQWNRYLSATLRLRAYVLRIGVARFVLFGKGVIGMPSTDIWSTCVDAAASISSILAAIDADQPQFQSARPESNYFLISGLGILLLAISQNAVLSVAERPLSPETLQSAQQSAILCLNLLRNRAIFSRPSKHLWNRVQSLAIRLNLINSPATSNQGAAAEQPEVINEMGDINSLPLIAELNLESFPSDANFRSSNLSGIAEMSVLPRNNDPPFGMDLDSAYIINELMAGFE
ncbi:hypothetical protein M441DRAFT_90581 [Trichoderma asperellum CBS 433.97]|uniref:Zn(2)-C6 fungal-type domain-containing protein n=1 Tax=Trichoderma asperellum (strain ATCC 204424 / CBS 433.97 / NBRC 101777) TaxID=1042311 RepID=A0A2T3Z663_TRIA4|nr:hypothetical protein M441DRAFT_90581 [Trichoderma asperellum CBS 433.97]PTB40299.1 hypothetical protein M441DRAFT_90581 [Trichoderma asperellum CBS 433.97]